MNSVVESNVALLALLFIGSAVFSAGLTYCVRNLARRQGWVRPPESHHIHPFSMPRLGGVAIYLTFVLFFALSAVMGWNAGWHDDLAVIAGGTVMLLLGLVDDFRRVPATVKLGCTVIAALILYGSGARLLETGPGLGWWSFASLVSLITTVAWVVLITNALNLVDGLDGLAAGSALFSIITLSGLALAGHDSSVVLTTLVLGGAVLGFLRYNFNPATIFLGDSGSLFLGFMLSSLALEAKRAAAPTLVAIAMPMVSFGLPIAETAVSVLRRFLGGKPLFAADNDHIHHRLLQMGFSHRQAVVVLYGICAACALLSLLLLYRGGALVGLVLLVVGTMFCAIIQRLCYPEFTELTRIAQRTFDQKRVIANDIAIRKVCQMLHRCGTWSEVGRALDSLLLVGPFDTYLFTLADGTTVSGDASKLRAVSASASGRWYSLAGVKKTGRWFINLDLEAADGTCLGTFALGHTYRRRSVLVDLNVVISELQPALTSACERLHENVVFALANESVPATRAELPQSFA